MAIEKIKVETSLAKAVYSRGPNQHISTPGHFSVYDKLTDERYWEKDCYDGGEGFGNLKESDVNNEMMEKFLELHKRYKKLITESDQQILDEITKPVKIEAKNPKYWQGRV